MKKQTISLISLMLIILTLTITGCNNGKESVAVTEYGVLQKGVTMEERYVYDKDNLLYIQDIQTNQSMLLCSKADCKHQAFDENSNPDPECEAATRPDCYSFCSVGMDADSVYAFESTANENEMVLYSRKISGQGWTKVGKIPYTIYGESNSYYIDGYAYIDGWRRVYPSRASDECTEETVILKVNLANGTYETLGSQYSALYWSRMRTMDYSDGLLCYENITMREGYTYSNFDTTSGDALDSVFDITVAVIDIKSGKEQIIEYPGFGYEEYVGFYNGIIYYKDKTGNTIKAYDIKKKSEQTIGECAKDVTIQNYLPYGLIYFTFDEGREKIYDIKKSEWREIKQPEEETTNSDSLMDHNDTYVRLVNWVEREGSEEATQQTAWLTWEDYIDGKRVAEQMESDLREPDLTEDYYEEHWNGKTVLTWWTHVNIPNHVIAKLNDLLVEKGKDYVLRAEYMPNYTEEYFDTLVACKGNEETLDIFTTPSQLDGEKEENKYRKCVDAGLMEPLNDFLDSSQGKTFYDTYYKEQWDGLRVDGKIYSYDWRSMGGQDICLVIKQSYIDKYQLVIDDTTTMADVFAMAKNVSEQENNGHLAPILWSMGVDERSLKEYPVEGLGKLRKQYSDLFQYYDTGSSDADYDFFAEFCCRDLMTLSDSEVVVNFPTPHVEACRTITVQKGTYMPVTNSMTAVASWSKHKAMAMDFIAMANTDTDVAMVLQFGEEGRDYSLQDNRVQLVNEDGFNPLCISNKWITKPYQLEPDDKEQAYRDNMEMHFVQ